MTLDALMTQNGVAFNADDVPSISVERLRQEILDGVGRGLRITAYFGLRTDDRKTILICVLANDAKNTLSVLSCDIGKRFESLTPNCPQAHLFEREIVEQLGVVPEGHPWLKAVRYPSSVRPIPGDTPFFSASGEELHEVAVGPVHAGIIEPGHFRFQCHGETVLHLEIGLGYQHRGAEQFLEAGPSSRSMVVAESIAGDTAIGHALAYCESLESLGGCSVSPRSQCIRAIALELERVANHVGDLGALCADIGFLPSAAYFGRLRGEFLNLLMELSGNRYGRGILRPGGVMMDIPPKMADYFLSRLSLAAKDFKEIADLMFSAASVQSRFERTGAISERICHDLGLVGPTARACGVPRDVRSDHPHGIYQFAHIPVSTATTGDVQARAMVRKIEVERSIDFLQNQIRNLPDGSEDLMIRCSSPRPDRMSVCMVESWRGEIAHTVLTDSSGRIRRYKVKDPSFHNWMALSMALRESPISDFPLCNKSFNLSYAGHDL